MLFFNPVQRCFSLQWVGVNTETPRFRVLRISNFEHLTIPTKAQGTLRKWGYARASGQGRVLLSGQDMAAAHVSSRQQGLPEQTMDKIKSVKNFSVMRLHKILPLTEELLAFKDC